MSIWDLCRYKIRPVSNSTQEFFLITVSFFRKNTEVIGASLANLVLTLVLVVPKINGLISVGNAAGKPDKKIYEKAVGILKKTPVVDG